MELITFEYKIKLGPLGGSIFVSINSLMPYPCSYFYLSNLATDYIQKRRGEPGLFSFEYNR